MANRKRFNRAAICSSENYRASKKAHIEYIKEQHSHFSGIAISSQDVLDILAKLPKVKVVKVFGKEMKVSLEEYYEHYAPYGF